MRRFALPIVAALVFGTLSSGVPTSATQMGSAVDKPYDGLVVLVRTETGLDVMHVDLDGRSVTEAMEEEWRRPGVVSVGLNYRVEVQSIPNDPLQRDQEHLGASNGITFGIDAAGAWNRTIGSPDVVVAVVDSGVQPHSEFAGRLLPGYDFVDYDSDARDPGTGGRPGCWYEASSWHGTHVAGLIAAGANGFGTVGVAPGVNILPVRALGDCGSGNTDDILRGVLWAAGFSIKGIPTNPYPAHIINMSLGGRHACDSLENDVYQAVAELGVLVVTSAGNSNIDARLSSPANCPNTLAVGASLRNGGRTSYSNYGPAVDIYAPGGSFWSLDGEGGILSTVDSGHYSPKSDSYERMPGTSMAAPIVSGVAALLKSVKPSATPGEIAAALRASAVACRGGTCPTGIVNARLAVDAIMKGVIERPIDSPSDDVTFPTAPAADPSISQDRYGGQVAAEVSETTARYAASRRSMQGLGTFDHAVIASHTSFADALTASVYAGAVDGVILFTDPARLSAPTLRVIEDLGITNVTLIGGPAALSTAIEETFVNRGLNVDRLWGANRYDTARAVSSKVLEDSRYLFIASGRNFADAVAVGPITYAGQLPMVLAGANGLDADTQNLIIEWQELNPYGQVVILGGTAAVPSSVETQLGALKRPFRESDGYWGGGGFCDNYPSNWPTCPVDLVPVGIPSYRIGRIGGADRFETAAKIAQWASTVFFEGSSSDVGFATGKTFTDALAAANILGQDGFDGPLLLTGTCMRMPRATFDAARGFKSQRVVGSDDALCDFDADVLRGKR